MAAFEDDDQGWSEVKSKSSARSKVNKQVTSSGPSTTGRPVSFEARISDFGD